MNKQKSLNKMHFIQNKSKEREKLIVRVGEKKEKRKENRETKRERFSSVYHHKDLKRLVVLLDNKKPDTQRKRNLVVYI